MTQAIVVAVKSWHNWCGREAKLIL